MRDKSVKSKENYTKISRITKFNNQEDYYLFFANSPSGIIFNDYLINNIKQLRLNVPNIFCSWFIYKNYVF
jgi:hypothetical protein